MQELDKDQTEQVTGALVLRNPKIRPPVTTLAIGEEGGGITTLALGEEGGGVTTKAIGEEGPIFTTLAVGEEGGGLDTAAAGGGAFGSF